jgi:glycosyltransferase involved in cell wall biosynthesis
VRTIITTPSLDPNIKVAGISAVTGFIIENNIDNKYIVFEIGKKDDERRDIMWFLNILKTYFKWCHLLLCERKALIHFNLALAKPSIIRDSPLIIIARILKKRMVIHLHGGDYLMHKNLPTWMKWLLKFDFGGKHPIIVLSPLEQAALKERLNINSVVLCNCVNVNDSFAYNRNYDNDEMNLLFLGRISDQKGIEYIYQALKLLKQTNLKFKFTMAGRGRQEQIYVQKFRDLLDHDFDFKGVVSGEQKIKVLKENNVFLLPSFFEGLPMALLESMSFGLVPITTDVGSIGYIITDGENGIFVKRYSSEDIVSALQRLSVDKELRNQLSVNARNYIYENFKPEEYISHLNKIYNYE